MQGVMSLLLGCISIILLVMLRNLGYSSVVLICFLAVGITLIFSGDYLLNPFKLPVTSLKQEFASDIGLIAYGVLYFSIAMSNLLQPRWFTIGLPIFLQPIWVRRGLAGIGIVLMTAGIYGIYHLCAGQLSDDPLE